jgi:hypothetical protein
MNEKNYCAVLDALGAQLQEKDFKIFLLNHEIETLKKKLEEAEKHIDKGEEK